MTHYLPNLGGIPNDYEENYDDNADYREFSFSHLVHAPITIPPMMTSITISSTSQSFGSLGSLVTAATRDWRIGPDVLQPKVHECLPLLKFGVKGGKDLADDRFGKGAPL